MVGTAEYIRILSPGLNAEYYILTFDIYNK